MTRPPQAADAALPDGWSIEYPAHRTNCSILHAANKAGMVTIDWSKRIYRLGYSTQRGAQDSTAGFYGRNWRSALLAAAVESLNQATGKRHD